MDLNLKNIMIILAIMAITLIEAYVCLLPFKFEDGYDGISYYSQINEPRNPISLKHPLFILLKPLAGLSMNDFMLVLRWGPALLFNLAIFLMFGATPYLALSLISMVVVSNPATAEMVSMILFCMAYVFRNNWKTLPLMVSSVLAHRYGFAWIAVLGITRVLSKFNVIATMRLTAVPLALLWACISLYYVKYGYITPSYVYEICVFASLCFPMMTYFMLRSTKPENVTFIWIIVFGSLLFIYLRYALTNDMPLLFKNIYNEYVRIVVMGLVPMMIFFLAEERKKFVIDGYILLIVVNALMNLLQLVHIIPLQLLRVLQCITALVFFLAWGMMYLKIVYNEVFPKRFPNVRYDI